MNDKMDHSHNKPPLIIISGSTGSGKSDIALKLAKKIDGEIISADSVAVYKGLDIGSAKPEDRMLKEIRHHLIDILEPDEYFGVDTFIRYAEEALNDILSRGKIPIMVGGTAFYIQAFIYGVDLSEEIEHDDSFRNMLYDKAEGSDGKLKLYERLKEVDPDYALSVHPNNVKRVVRALEYNHYTGKLFSEYNHIQSLRESEYDHLYFALTYERDILYKRIDRRVDLMIEAGLADEVRTLLNAGLDRDLNSMSSIGYKEMAAYICGECSLEDAIADIKKNSRHYAKRQLTWLRRERDVDMIVREDNDEVKVIEYIISKAKESGLIP